MYDQPRSVDTYAKHFSPVLVPSEHYRVNHDSKCNFGTLVVFATNILQGCTTRGYLRKWRIDYSAQAQLRSVGL